MGEDQAEKAAHETSHFLFYQHHQINVFGKCFNTNCYLFSIKSSINTTEIDTFQLFMYMGISMGLMHFVFIEQTTLADNWCLSDKFLNCPVLLGCVIYLVQNLRVIKQNKKCTS